MSWREILDTEIRETKSPEKHPHNPQNSTRPGNSEDCEDIDPGEAEEERDELIEEDEASDYDTAHQNSSVRPEKRLISVQDAGVYLGVSLWTIRAYISDGELPAVRAGRRVLLDIRDLDAWIERAKFREEQW